MSIPPEALVQRLRSLNPTQQSIEGTSHWALFFASDQSNVTAIVSAWGEEIGKAPNEKKLALLYLSNHILQEGKRKGRLFGEEFSKVISKAVREVLRTADPKTRSSVGRVVRVWEERRVFGSSVIKGLKEQVTKAEAANKGSSKGSNGGGLDEATMQKLQALGPLAQLLSEASMAAEKSQEHTTKALQLQQHILEVGSIAEVASAQAVLSNCLSVLETEVQCRQQAAGELREQVSKQEDAMRHAQQQLQQFEQQKAMADARMGTLEQQRQQQQQQRLQQQQQQQQQQPLPNGMAGPGGGGIMGQPPPPPQLAQLMALQGISGPMPTIASMGLPPGVPGPLSHPMGPQAMPFASMPLPPPEAMLMAMQQQQQGLLPVPPPQALAMMAASGGLPPPHLPAPPFSAPPAAVPGHAHPQPQPPTHAVLHQPQQQRADSTPIPQPQPPHLHPQPPQQPQPQPSRPGAAPPPPSQPMEPQQPQRPQPQQQQQPPQEQQQQQQQQQPNLETSTDQDTAAMFAKAFAEMPEEERQRLAAGMAAAVAHTSQAPSSAPSGPPPPPPGGPTPSQAGEGGTNGVQEDSLLADADFSRFILGEDPMAGQGEYGGDDDYDPENPF
ncbi:RNA polymerase II-binding domain-containing protein [Dunaliella salina]|uniref:RNA polymerase II-binding domain-containing protein n=1 Tax=Dunaliella salina TaxID=3046 RepID=A0ABQ7G4W5_DUNSA|nr:RNA polymerase II-binding domain-containing protein [Dunaliella salina]|eukprot:KAF5829649.1 RNA polymerase II-binding domain-containing protein [Dunaliella salina]